MRRHVKRCLARLAPAATQSGFRILLYHSLGPPVPGDRLGLRVPPNEFVRQMQQLRSGACRIVPLEAVLSDTEWATATVAVTFDDGYHDQLERAVPVLQALGIPATFFLTTRLLDGRADGGRGYWERWPHLTWRGAHELARAGMSIGSHSVEHARLPELSTAGLVHELQDSKKALEDRLGVRVASFSYPHGEADRRVKQAVEEAGYELACGSLFGINRPPVDRFALRRTEIDAFDRLDDFAGKLDGRYDWLGRWQRWRGHA